MHELMTLNEINSTLKNLADKFPRLCTLVTLPNKTHRGQDSFALEMGLPNKRTNRASLIIGGVHAREWGGPDIVALFANDIVNAYAEGKGLAYGQLQYTAEQIEKLFTETTMVVFPCVNPDGFEYSRTKDSLWRKNRRPTRDGEVGVDINRNYDFLWDFKKHFHPTAHNDSLASAKPSSQQYHGEKAFSEAETQNVKWLMDRYTGLRWFLDVHSFSGKILYRWGDDNNQSQQKSMSFTNPAYDGSRGYYVPPMDKEGHPLVNPNNVDHSALDWTKGDEHGRYIYGEYISGEDQAISRGSAELMAEAMNAVFDRNGSEQYAAQQSLALYPTSGASDDYAFSRCFADPSLEKVHGFTLEFNFGPRTDPSRFHVTTDPAVLTRTLTEVVPGLIAFAQFATAPIVLERPPIDQYKTDHTHTNVFTGDSWTITPQGIIHHPPPPDWYVSDLGRTIGRLLAAHESLSRTPGAVAEQTRTMLLGSIATLAQGKG